MIFGYSHIRHEVFVLTAKSSCHLQAKIDIETKLLPLNELTLDQWKQLKQLQGKLGTYYLKLRYGSRNTHVLLAYNKDVLVHVEWIVPATKIKKRYPFITEDSYVIISCLTSNKFRGLNIYPSQIQKVLESGIGRRGYLIWASSDNTASLRGIKKVGGIKTAEFIQKKWLWGIVSKVEYFSEKNNK